MKIYSKITFLIIVVAAGIGLSSGLFASRIMHGKLETELKKKAQIIVQVMAGNIIHY